VNTMKKIVNILSTILIIILFHITKNNDMLPLTISFVMYILLNSIFSSVMIKNKNYNLFKLTTISIIILGLIITTITYFIGTILNINNLNIINIFMTISLISNILLKLMKQYLEIINYKKISCNITNIYKIITSILKIILIILLYKVFTLENYINIILLYSVDILIFIPFIIVLYIYIFKKLPKENKVSINYIKEIKKILLEDKTKTILNIINSTYLYTGVIILYYILTNKYNYNYNDISIYITNTYLYGIITMYITFKIIKKYLNINIKDNFTSNINKILKISIPLVILLTIISKPISIVIFGTNQNILANLIPLLLAYIIYDFIINTAITYNKQKNIITILIIGLITKLIFELPLINSVYRMGYSLTLGSILSMVLGLTITTTIGIILIKNKLKINLLNNFNNLLNIIYENIIYTLVLVIFTLIVKINTTTIIESILVIIFYIFILIIYYIIKRILNKN